MKQERLAYLLNQLMAEQASDAEHQELLELIADPANEVDAKRELFEAYQTAENLQDLIPKKRDQILEAIFQSDKQIEKSGSRYHFFNLKTWTAAAILLISISVGIYFLTQTEHRQYQSAVLFKQDIHPGKNQATLTLANGSVISLTDANRGKIANEAGLVITKGADGQLVYKAVDHGEAKASGYNTIITPYGGKYEIVLQDGTRVVLNSGSKITYPLVFDQEHRVVTLTGEAYFEVAKDMNRPFIVTTPSTNGIQSQKVQVLGTHFNISAYEDERSYITTLLEGSVKVSAGNGGAERLLKPGQQSILRQSLDVSEANIDAAVAWKDDVFYFTDVPIQDMMRKLARWYNLEIVYHGEMPSIGFWAQISRNKNLSEVLQLIAKTNRVRFQIEGRTVIVTQLEKESPTAK